MVYEPSQQRSGPDLYADSLLGLLLDTQDEAGVPIPDVEIRDQMMTMLLAGHETTANALVWAWYSRARTGRSRQASSGAGRGSVEGAAAGNRTSAYGRYRDLPYTRQVIQETLRLYPPAWAILREAEQGFDMLGDRFPPKAASLSVPMRFIATTCIRGCGCLSAGAV